MSGFEVLGLACSIFLTISFAHETLTICIALYDKQKTPDAEVEEIASSMVVAAEKVTAICDESKKLNNDIAQIASNCKNDTLGEEIARIAKGCTKIASQLKSEVKKITSLDPSGNLLIAIKVASKSLWKKSKLKKLNENLCSYREQMQTLLITQIWAITKTNNLTQDPAFHNQDGAVQDLIANLEKGYTKIEDLLKRQAASTQAHITDQFVIAKRDIKDHNDNLWKVHEKDATTKTQLERLQKSFEFPDMNARRNAILDPRDATFGRIFLSYTNTINRKNSPRTKAIDVVWKSFVDWLRSDEPLFWIQGKPGAGKSTLMKYIVDHEETQNLLDQWCTQSRIISHYFWKVGSTMENNIQGLYCSLIHQLIEENEELMAQILDEFTFAQKKTYVNDWSAPELDGVLDYILHSTADRGPLCIFIDGLDEYCGEGGQKYLTERIKSFAQHEEVKLCVSSRPEQRLLESFSMTPNLRLQELTRPDMASYIHERLGIFQQRGQISSRTLDTMASLLIGKAEGVFLWLQLAIQSIENGIENEDSNKLLITRLKDLPSDIENLYTDMWTRLNQDLNVYRESAALLFQFLIRFQEFRDQRPEYIDPSLELQSVSLFDTACWRDENLQKRLLDMRYKMSSEEIVRACERAEKEIRIRCAGLLEVQPLVYSVESELDSVLRRVDFVHSTAHDFLVGTEAGRQILSYGKLSATETLTQLTKGAFCKSRIAAKLTIPERLPDPMLALECLSRMQSDKKDWAGEWFAIAERFYNAGLLEKRILPRPSFLCHIKLYPDLYGPAISLFQKADAPVASEVLRLWEWWWDWPSRNPQTQKGIVKVVHQLMSRDPDLAAAQAYVGLPNPGRSSRWDRPKTANRTTALWQFGQASLQRELGWRTKPPGPHNMKPTFPQAPVAAIMSRPTTLDQWGLVTTVQVRPGGRSICVPQIDNVASPREWGTGNVSPVFMLNTSFLLKHPLDGLLTHCPDKMAARLRKIRDQIPNSVPCISFICISDQGRRRWFRVIDQTPLQSITHVIFDPTIPLYEPNEGLEQFRKLAIDLMHHPKVMEQVQLEDVLRAPAEEGRLGPCRLQDAGFQWSEEEKRVIEVGTERPECALLDTAENATTSR